MVIKKSILSLLVLCLVLAAGCSKQLLKQVYFDGENASQLNCNFTIPGSQNMDKILSSQKYLYSTDTNKKYIALITYKSKNVSINQYLIRKDGAIDLSVPEDSQFVISLPANRTIAYTWNIKNNINNGIIQFDKRSWIEIPMPAKIETTGDNYDRQNFYFSPLKTGNEKLVIRYEHQTQQQNEYFEVTINIKIE